MGLISNGTTIFDAGSVASGLGGSMTFIKKLTADGTATNLSFVHGSASVVLDNTYKEYLFTFNNIHPATDQADFQVNFRDGGTDYDATKTSTNVQVYHAEAGDGAALDYDEPRDLAESTAVVNIIRMIGNGNDESGCGFLHLYEPSNTTFIKHFVLDTHAYNEGDYSVRRLITGYCNTTTAIDGVQFSMSSGNMDAGDICLYGIS